VRDRFPRRYALAVLAALAAAASGSWLLFFQPIVGIADNRDFWRVLVPSGLAYRTSLDTTVFFFIQGHFDVVAPHPVHYLTSELLFTKLAVAIHRHLFGAGPFDLRLLGACHLAVYAPAVGLFVAAHRRRALATQLGLACLTVLMFCDVKLVAHFNSFYSESASLIFGILMLAGAMWACEPSSARVRWVSYVAFVAAAILFGIAKPQNLVFLAPLAVLAYELFPAATADDLYARGRRRVLALLVAVAMLAIVPWALLSDAYDATRGVNVAVHLDEELFPHSPTPNRDRLELGISGHHYENVSLGSLARFYLHHPRRWWNLASRAMQEAFWCITHGNYEVSAGKPPGTNSARFSLWSELQRRCAPRSLPVLIAICWTLGALWTRRIFTAAAKGADRRRALVALLILLGCIGEFIVTITFEANGNAKHLFIFNVMVDAVLLFALADATDAVTAWAVRRRAR
jgi:hypothetical protein